jgi:hypothetical protein
LSSLTLLAKARNNFQLRQADSNLKAILKGLDVKLDVTGANARGWIQVLVSGEDEKVALRYLMDRIGFCPIELEKVVKFSTFRGFVRDSSQDNSEMSVDIGVVIPETVDAMIPLNRLQAQLGDSRKIALAKLVELFGLRENVPLDIRVTNVDVQNKFIEAELSDKQLRQFSNWTRAMLDRLLIVGASYRELRSAMKESQIERDIVRIEPLGMFEYAITCKLGTDAAGLIPKIGRRLERAVFTVFNPRNVFKLIGFDAPITSDGDIPNSSKQNSID